MSDTEQSSIRESLSAAFDKQAETTAPAERSEAPASAAQPETPPATSTRQRDESGRFATKSKEEAPKAEAKADAPPATGAAESTTHAETPAETTPASKPPQSWTPAAREEWAKIPVNIQQEVLKREKEVGRVLSESAGARKAWQEVETTLTPYRDMLTAPPVQVIGNLLQTAAVLHRGSPMDKAALVATIMRGYGVSPDAVADALEGKAAQATQGQQYRDPRVDDLLRRQQMADHQSQQAQAADAQRSLQEFEATNPEFLDDVKADMLVLLESGRAKTYTDAYRKACAMSEEVATVVKQRQDKARETAQAATTRAKAAASSVKSEPAVPGNGAQPTSLRGTLEAAIASHSGR